MTLNFSSECRWILEKCPIQAVLYHIRIPNNKVPWQPQLIKVPCRVIPHKELAMGTGSSAQLRDGEWKPCRGKRMPLPHICPFQCLPCKLHFGDVPFTRVGVSSLEGLTTLGGPILRPLASPNTAETWTLHHKCWLWRQHSLDQNPLIREAPVTGHPF